MPHISSAMDLCEQMQHALQRHSAELEKIITRTNSGENTIIDLANENMLFSGEIARVVEQLALTVSLLADASEWSDLGSGSGVETP